MLADAASPGLYAVCNMVNIYARAWSWQSMHAAFVTVTQDVKGFTHPAPVSSESGQT